MCLETKFQAVRLRNDRDIERATWASSYCTSTYEYLICRRKNHFNPLPWFIFQVDLSDDQLKVFQNDDGPIKEKNKGDRAHLTLGTKGKEVKPVETGFDVLRALDGTSRQVAETEDGTLWRNPDGVYTLRLNTAWTCDALFTGHYT